MPPNTWPCCAGSGLWRWGRRDAALGCPARCSAGTAQRPASGPVQCPREGQPVQTTEQNMWPFRLSNQINFFPSPPGLAVNGFWRHKSPAAVPRHRPLPHVCASASRVPGLCQRARADGCSPMKFPAPSRKYPLSEWISFTGEKSLDASPQAGRVHHGAERQQPAGPGDPGRPGTLYHWGSGVTRVALRRAALLAFYSKLKTTGCSGKRVQPPAMRLTRPGTSKPKTRSVRASCPDLRPTGLAFTALG